MKFMLPILLLISIAHASIEQAPPSFSYREDRAVFIDFKKAHYEITYDFVNQTAQVDSVIHFEAATAGYPIFDLIQDPQDVSLDDINVSTEAIKDPDAQTTMRVVQDKISAGKHVLRIRHQIVTNVIFADTGVASGFWMSDLNDRRYLEQYLPTNLEFDQYKMSMLVHVIGAQGIPHLLKANGKVTKLQENTFEVSFPEFYSASSMYFHLFPEKNSANVAQFYFPSIDGRLIPVDIYTTFNVQEFVDATNTILRELESDYGPFPHNQLIIYGNALTGGMEHSGATITSLKALGHELFHSYHARGLMPANGNAGWMDEAIARWRDNSYPLITELQYASGKLAGHSIWSRMTDRNAYADGSAFLSWVAHRMNEKGLNFKKFLKDYFDKYKYTTVTTQLFQLELTLASGLDLSADFDRYIYGKTSTLKKFSTPRVLPEDPNHPKLTKEELLDLTWL